MAEVPEAEATEPATHADPQDRETGDSITDYGAVAFLFVLFFLAIGLMYLIGHGRP
jgi:hypothetical protein